MKLLLKKIGYILSFLFPNSFFNILEKMFRTLYSGYKSRKLKSFGKNSSFYYPVTLIGEKYISIGNNSSIGKRSILSAWDKQGNEHYNPLIIIGNNVSIGEDCHITAINKIIIGNNVLFGKKVTVSDNSHGNVFHDDLHIPPLKRTVTSKGPVILKDNVWIGDKVTILQNVSIGEGSIIGANAVVTKSFPPYSVIAGNPAKVIKTLDFNQQ